MNTNRRALIVGIAAAAAMTLTFDAVGALRGHEVIRLEGITVTAQQENFDSDGNLKVIRLDPIVDTAHKGNG